MLNKTCGFYHWLLLRKLNRFVFFTHARHWGDNETNNTKKCWWVISWPHAHCTIWAEIILVHHSGISYHDTSAGKLAILRLVRLVWRTLELLYCGNICLNGAQNLRPLTLWLKLHYGVWQFIRLPKMCWCTKTKQKWTQSRMYWFVLDNTCENRTMQWGFFRCCR